METLTDILAISGWAVFGFIIPELFVKRSDLLTNFLFAISFGLIAASLVLG